MIASPLTPRQMDVLAAYCALNSAKETAAHLGITEATVKNHLYRIYRVLKVPGGCTACMLYGRWTADVPRAGKARRPEFV